MASSQRFPGGRRIQFLLLFFVFLAVSTGCKKEGKQGEQGPPGTANVQYSDWFTPATFTVATRFGIINFDYTQPVPAITQDILDKGTVLVYGKLNGYNTTLWPADQVKQLPIQVYYKSGATTNIDTWSASSTAGNLRINLLNSTNAYANDQAISHQHAFRYIIIPGGQKITGLSGNRSISSRQAEDVSRLSYQEICRALDIPE